MKKKDLSFEQMKAELEQIAEAIEDSSLPYEKLKELFDRGEFLASQLDSMLSSELETVEKKIKQD